MKNLINNMRLSVLFIILMTVLLNASNSNVYAGAGAVIQIKTAIEGLCDPENGVTIKDAEMYVYLRSAKTPYEIAGMSKGFIDKRTLIGTFEFTKIVSGQYYIILKSKNTVETWSRDGGELIMEGTKSFYDFTDFKEKAFGDNLKFNGNYKYQLGCIYTGDVNQDNFINQRDADIVYESVLNFTEGDVPEDLNGDNYVTLEDLLICYNNANANVKAITPLNGNFSDENFTLNQNKPNPFNPSTQIKIDVPNTSNVKLSIYDITGREIAQLVNTILDKGSYTFEWNATDFSSGTYFYRAEVNGIVKSMKMNLIK